MRTRPLGTSGSVAGAYQEPLEQEPWPVGEQLRTIEPSFIFWIWYETPDFDSAWIV